MNFPQTKRIRHQQSSVCLEELASLLSPIFTRSGKTRSYHRFDISGQQFPEHRPSSINMSIHNVLKPFPVHHRHKYDLVYIRLLCLAFRETELSDFIDPTRLHHLDCFSALSAGCRRYVRLDGIHPSGTVRARLTTTVQIQE